MLPFSIEFRRRVEAPVALNACRSPPALRFNEFTLPFKTLGNSPIMSLNESVSTADPASKAIGFAADPG